MAAATSATGSPPQLARAAAENARLVRDIRGELSEVHMLAALAERRRAYEGESAAIGVRVRAPRGAGAGEVEAAAALTDSPVKALAALTVRATV